MGKVLLAAAAIVLSIAPAVAQDSPWCVKLDVFTKNCAYASYQECIAVAHNATGPATGVGQCIRNPDYHPPGTAVKSTKATPAKASSPPPR